MTSGKRTRIGNRYVTRDAKGQFKTNVDVGRSLSADRRRKSSNQVQAGHGHQGDLKRAESRFDKLEDEVAEQYEKKGYTKEEAEEIGAKVAYTSGVKKYGKKGMERMAKRGRERAKAERNRARKASSKTRTMARKGARRAKAMAFGAESATSYSRSADTGQVNYMSWENSAPYATLEGYNPVDSILENPPIGYGVTQNFGADEGDYYESHHQGYDDKMDESLGMRHRGRHSQSMKDRRDEASAMDKRHSKMGRKYDDVMTMDAQGYDDKMDESLGMRHRGRHSQSMKDRRDEASAMDKMHSKMGRKYDDVMTMDAEYDSPYGPRQSTEFGVVGMGNDFAQNAAENFSAEGGSQFMTGARYGAGAVVGITGATIALGMVIRMLMPNSN